MTAVIGYHGGHMIAKLPMAPVTVCSRHSCIHTNSRKYAASVPRPTRREVLWVHPNPINNIHCNFNTCFQSFKILAFVKIIPGDPAIKFHVQALPVLG